MKLITKEVTDGPHTSYAVYSEVDTKFGSQPAFNFIKEFPTERDARMFVDGFLAGYGVKENNNAS